jgi:transposase
VVDIAAEKDPNVLRQLALLLDGENRRLHTRLKSLLSENAALKGQSESDLQHELFRLQELLAQREHALFGRSSEKRQHTCGGSDQPKPESPSRKQTGHGPKAQPGLPIVEVKHELDEPDKICPKCGGELCEMEGQFEESEEIDVVERTFVLKKHKRLKYRCGCNAHIETAEGPQKLGPNNRYSLDFAIEIAIAKYLDHLPLERQVRMMLREGLDVDSQTLWDQIELLARQLLVLPELILQHLMKKLVVGADETHWLMLTSQGLEQENKRWYVWNICGDDGVFYRIFDSRSHEAAGELLGQYDGTVMCDGYAAYEKLRKKGGLFRLAHCWSHVRRKFIAAEKSYAREAGAIVNLIDEMFATDRLCPTGPPDDEERLRLLTQLRQDRSQWIIKALECWGSDLMRTVLPKSTMGKALKYMAGLWTGLTRFLTDPRIPLSNNASERVQRGVVVGRKNHYGSKSKRGTEVAALFYTIIESAKLCGLEPKAYLRHAARAALRGEIPQAPHEVAMAGNTALAPAPKADTLQQ